MSLFAIRNIFSKAMAALVLTVLAGGVYAQAGLATFTNVPQQVLSFPINSANNLLPDIKLQGDANAYYTVFITQTNSVEMQGQLSGLTDAYPAIPGLQLTGSPAEINTQLANLKFSAGAVAGTSHISIHAFDGAQFSSFYEFTLAAHTTVANNGLPRFSTQPVAYTQLVESSSNGVFLTKEGFALQADGKILKAAEQSYAWDDVEGRGVAVWRLHPNGTMDTSFGDQGKALVEHWFGYGTQIVAAPDGSTYIAGSYGIARLDANGVQDMSYGSNGIWDEPLVFSGVNYSLQNLHSFIALPDGRQLVTGTVLDYENWDPNAIVFRLNRDGSIDRSFGVDGRFGFNLINDLTALTDDQEGSIDQMKAVVSYKGSIVISYVESIYHYSTYSRTDFESRLITLTADGQLDTNFANAGVLSTNYIYSDVLQLDANGKIRVVATTAASSTPVLLRYNSNGTLDTSLGNNGVVTFPFSDLTHVSQLQLMPNEKTVVNAVRRITTGNITWPYNGIFLLTSSNTLDTSFGVNGWLETEFESFNVQGNGNIVISDRSTWSSVNPKTVNIRQVRGTTGAPDTSFGSSTPNTTLDNVAAFTQGGSAVTLDGSVDVYDPDHTANFSGASFVLARDGGANTEDVLSFNSSSTVTSNGSNVLVGGISIGSISNTAGRLRVAFNSSATPTRVKSFLQAIQYRNTSSYPPLNVTMRWTLIDAAGATASETTKVAITRINFVPQISGTPSAAITSGQAYSFVPTVVEMDEDDTLQFSISNKPTWASFNTATGALTGTPARSDHGSYSNIVISVSDGQAQAQLPAFSINVTAANTAPVISGAPSVTTLALTQTFSFMPTAVDAENDALTFSISNKPTWVSFDAATGTLSGTPTLMSQIGSYNDIVISVTDAFGAQAALPAFNLTVIEMQYPPVFSTSPATATINKGELYQASAVATDANNDTLLYSLINAPAWLQINANTGAISGTPGNGDVGSVNGILVRVSDGQFNVDSAPFNLHVLDKNYAPTINGQPPLTVLQDQLYQFAVQANDPDEDTLSFSVVNAPSWLSINAQTGVLSGTPGNDDVGVHGGIVVRVSDGEFTVALSTFAIEVVNVNDAPTISGTPMAQINQNEAYVFSPQANDIDSDTLQFSASNLPSWLSINAQTGEIVGTPAQADVGLHSGIVVTVSDGALSASLPAFAIEVINVNDAPTISGTPATSVLQDQLYSFSPVAADMDGDSLSFSVSNLPVWLTFDSTTGLLQGTATNDDVGTYSDIAITVTDGELHAQLPAFAIDVINVNDAPTISGVPASFVEADQTYSFTPQAQDIDGDSLIFTVTNLPSWAQFDSASGALTGSPNNGHVGVYANIVITVSDGTVQVPLTAFTITVREFNYPPVISGEPALSVQQDVLYYFAPTASDDNGDTLIFSAQNLPSWLALDVATGAISGTPSQADVGIYNNIVITVSDGAANTALPAFNLEVVNVNDAPEISGVPAISVNQDQPYLFVPQATDLDNDTLTFSVNNLPAWAQFDSQTGALSGAPANVDVGVYGNIEISVTDGELTVALPAFAIEVVNVNDAPTISGVPAAVARIELVYSFVPLADDIDGDTLSFSVVNKPNWASFNAQTGELTGMPTAADVGLYGNIEISVSDGVITVALPVFTIEVRAINAVPEISGIPADFVMIGMPYQFLPQASDADGDTLQFSATNLPAWLQLNAQTGELSGTPDDDDFGVAQNIVLSVSDGEDTVSLPAFAITVGSPFVSLDFIGAAAKERLAAAVALGDMDGDGGAEILLGAPYRQALINGKRAKNVGAIDVISMVIEQQYGLIGSVKNARFGTALAVLDDQNNDGVAELLIGNPFAGKGGELYVVDGASGQRMNTVLQAASPKVTAEQLLPVCANSNEAVCASLAAVTIGARIGYVLHSADINRDGVADIVLGLPNATVSMPVKLAKAGAVIVIDGASMLPLSLRVGTQKGEAFGSAVAFDAANDELLIGSPKFDVATAKLLKDAGRVQRFAADGNGVATAEITGNAAKQLLGDAVASFGQDLNADGESDWLVARPGDTSGRQLLLVSGAQVQPAAVALPAGIVRKTGSIKLAAGADINGDRFNDAVIGLPMMKAQGTVNGKLKNFKNAGAAKLLDGSVLFQ